MATPLPPVLCRGFLVAAASTALFHCSYCAFSSSFLKDSFRGGTTTGAAVGGGGGGFPPPPPPADWISLAAPPTIEDVRFKLKMAHACSAGAGAGAGGRIVVVLGLGRALFCADPPSTAVCEEEEEEAVADPSLGAKEEEGCNCRAAESWPWFGERRNSSPAPPPPSAPAAAARFLLLAGENEEAPPPVPMIEERRPPVVLGPTRSAHMSCMEVQTAVSSCAWAPARSSSFFLSILIWVSIKG